MFLTLFKMGIIHLARKIFQKNYTSYGNVRLVFRKILGTYYMNDPMTIKKIE